MRMQDRGEYAAEPVYGKVLAGLHLVSRYTAIPLLDALLTWRKESLNVAARAPAEIIVLRKRVRVPCRHMMSQLYTLHGLLGFMLCTLEEPHACMRRALPAEVLPTSDAGCWMHPSLACIRWACSWRWRRCSWKPRCSWWARAAAR
jgi:hypothetical protein